MGCNGVGLKWAWCSVGFRVLVLEKGELGFSFKMGFEF